MTLLNEKNELIFDRTIYPRNPETMQPWTETTVKIFRDKLIEDINKTTLINENIITNKFELIINEISGDLTNVVFNGDKQQLLKIGSDFTEIVCPEETVLTVDVKIVEKESGTIANYISSAFTMPIVSDDGRKKILMPIIENGSSIFNIKMKDSGIWNVGEGEINERLPAEMKMDFVGIKIFVAEI